jgi:hypothetical protein
LGFETGARSTLASWFLKACAETECDFIVARLHGGRYRRIFRGSSKSGEEGKMVRLREMRRNRGGMQWVLILERIRWGSREVVTP